MIQRFWRSLPKPLLGLPLASWIATACAPLRRISWTTRFLRTFQPKRFGTPRGRRPRSAR